MIEHAEFVVGRRRIPYEIVRSTCVRNLNLSMTIDGLRVMVPAQTENAVIEVELRKKQGWILINYVSFQQKREKSTKVARIRSGAKIPFWGRMIAVRTHVSDLEEPSVTYKNGFYIAHPRYRTQDDQDQSIELAVNRYLKQRFSEQVGRYVKQYGKLLGVRPQRVTVKEMTRRWGSCTTAGRVTLDWRLVYGPKKVTAYVVAHELAHLKICEHNNDFWTLVRATFGDMEWERRWLSENEHLLGYVNLAHTKFRNPS